MRWDWAPAEKIFPGLLWWHGQVCGAQLSAGLGSVKHASLPPLCYGDLLNSSLSRQVTPFGLSIVFSCFHYFCASELPCPVGLGCAGFEPELMSRRRRG